ncbi:TPA: hypothetical protein ACX6SL_003730 [Photobacterium damselae]
MRKAFIPVAIIFFLYAYSMVLDPYLNGGFLFMMSTWHEWQTFNAGMIALAAAAISACVMIQVDRNTHRRHNELIDSNKRIAEEQRIRNFVAAKSFLPHALTDIYNYVEECSKILIDIYVMFNHKQIQLIEDENKKDFTNYFKYLNKPENYQMAFKECISLGNEEQSKQLSEILITLQIFISRMRRLENGENISRSDSIEMLVNSVYFGLRLNGLYDFARSGERIHHPQNKSENYYTRISTLLSDNFHFEPDNDEEIDKYIGVYSRKDGCDNSQK